MPDYGEVDVHEGEGHEREREKEERERMNRKTNLKAQMMKMQRLCHWET